MTLQQITDVHIREGLTQITIKILIRFCSVSSKLRRKKKHTFVVKGDTKKQVARVRKALKK